MKKETTKNKVTTKEKLKAPEYKINKIRFVLFVFFAISSLALFLSFIYYFTSGKYDQSTVNLLLEPDVKADNILGKFGAYLSNFFIYEGFGIASFLFVVILFHFSVYLLFSSTFKRFRKKLFWNIFSILMFCLFFGQFSDSSSFYLSGRVGFEINSFLEDYLGAIGTMLLTVFVFVVYLIYRIKWAPDSLINTFSITKAGFKNKIQSLKTFLTSFVAAKESDLENTENTSSKEIKNNSNAFSEKINSENIAVKDIKKEKTPVNSIQQVPSEPLIVKDKTAENEIILNNPLNTVALNLEPTVSNFTPNDTEKEISSEEFIIETTKEEEIIEENLAEKLVKDFGEFDPTLELSNFQFPSADLLQEHASTGITINQAELEENKNRIVETLNNYKIGIAQIKATVGPTVTLYEIVPEAGIRISKIKSLEDDIALSLSALGIRIIAPIPGKGTIGIEVPNAKSTVVSMKSLITSPKFHNAEMELPIALGKTISNETYVVDLAKMPHLLMAGATGQGKSVGLNAVLTSLLYRKHPAEVKFVLVDPKKVELTLFNKIERHYLAKLPNTDDAIITDNAKVINTLNSLCVEMDNRYSLLKEAMVRNIKEYNEKFKQRKLNPENGHKFLPYIVLVVDEFADLIMTAGKEVETPIARLAQLARAIGIHLIIATQRPSVNVITGIIKANFPARIAFRVSSKIDSRTILDGPGADQLIGRGDLLYTQGNDLIRVQCGFVDTPEVEKITDFIGSQKAYADAYLLPEYVGEEASSSLSIDISERDSLFKEAAEIIVTAQQGSASLLQRKLKLGYNRAGRLIDQLEAAGIVGPFEGSKARSVNIPDLVELDKFLDNQ